MIEKKLQTFIDGITNYFKHTADPEVEVGTPYLIDSIGEVSADFTGEIAVSGEYTGVCYFTAPTLLVRKLVIALGETDTSSDMMMDAVGEVANTLSGNARKELGENFIISVPHVYQGAPSRKPDDSKERIYAIPIKWKNQHATLGIFLTQ